MRRLALIIILDGLNTGVLSETYLPTISKFFLDSKFFSTRSCRSIYPSVTYPAHTSIVTGAFPNEHGIIGNMFYDRVKKVIISHDDVPPDKLIERRTIFEIASRNDLLAVSINEPTTKGADIVIPKSDIDIYPAGRRSEIIKERILDVIENYKPNLIVVNFSNFDTLGETYGPINDKILSAIEDFDAFFSELLDLLDKSYEDYMFIITSDHGMTEVNEKINIEKEFSDIAIALQSHRAVHIYGDVEEIINKLKDLSINEYYTKEEIKKLKLNHRRTGDVVAFAPPEIEFGEGIKGSHGGTTNDEMHVIFITNMPYAKYYLEDEVYITDAFKLARIYLTESLALELARRKMSANDPGHSFDHIERVLRGVTKLGIKYKADLFALRIATILHDVERLENLENHHIKSAEFAEKFLLNMHINKKEIEKIKKIIIAHENEPENLKSIEEKIMWDTDKLDCIGLIGLSRALLESGYKNQTIEEAIKHVLNDLRKFQGKFHLKETKKEAEKRKKALEQAIEILERETNPDYESEK